MKLIAFSPRYVPLIQPETEPLAGSEETEPLAGSEETESLAGLEETEPETEPETESLAGLAPEIYNIITKAKEPNNKLAEEQARLAAEAETKAQ